MKEVREWIKRKLCKHTFEGILVYEGGYDDYYKCKCTKCSKTTTFGRHETPYVKGEYILLGNVHHNDMTIVIK